MRVADLRNIDYPHPATKRAWDAALQLLTEFEARLAVVEGRVSGRG